MKSKFEEIYQEALVNLNPPQTNNAPTSTPNAPQKLDTAKLNMLSQKMAKAQEQNQPLNLTPEEMEALKTLLGGNDTQQSQNDQQPQQNNADQQTQNTTQNLFQKQQIPIK